MDAFRLDSMAERQKFYLSKDAWKLPECEIGDSGASSQHRERHNPSMSYEVGHIRQWNIAQDIPSEVLEMLVSLDVAGFVEAMRG